MVSSWGGGGDEERRVAPVLDLSYCISDARPGDSAQGSLYMTRDTNSPHKIIEDVRYQHCQLRCRCGCRSPSSRRSSRLEAEVSKRSSRV